MRGEAREALWVCMICAHVGCGRYYRSHALQHFRRMSHRYTCEVQNEYIWDYYGEGYVHRLRGRSSAAGSSLPSSLTRFGAASLDDTQEAMYPGHTKSATDPYDSDEFSDDGDLDQQELLNIKLQSITTHYNQLLNDTLQQQYDYFEGKLSEAQAEMHNQLQALSSESSQICDQNMQLSRKIASLTSRIRNNSKRITSLKSTLSKVKSENGFLHDLNLQLDQDQRAISEQADRRAEASASAASSKRSGAISKQAKAVAQQREVLKKRRAELDRLMIMMSASDHQQQDEGEAKAG